MATPGKVSNPIVGSNKTAGTTLVSSSSGQIQSGSLLVACVLFDNAATASKPIVSSITKKAGETNSWVFLGAARSTSTSSGAFSSAEMWYIQTTLIWTSGATYTVTLDTSVTMKAFQVYEFSDTTGTLRNTMGAAYSTTTAAASASTTGTLPEAYDLGVGFIFGSNVATAPAGCDDTTAGSWQFRIGVGTTGSTAATNNYGGFQYKVLTMAGVHTPFFNSAAMTAGNGAIVATFKSIPPVITQAAYAFFAAGGQDTSFLAAQDTAPSINVDSNVNLQLRVLMQSGAVDVLPNDLQLQFAKNGGAWTNVYSDPRLLTAYPLPQMSFSSPVSSASGQSFTGNGEKLSKMGFDIARTGSPPGTYSAALYAHAGTLGTSSVGTGAALATSTTVINGTSIPTTQGWVFFDFDETFTLANGTNYVAVITRSTAGDASNNIGLAYDVDQPTHPGNMADYNGTTWSPTGGGDYITQVYTKPATLPTTVAGHFSSAMYGDTTAIVEEQPTVNRLTGGTGSFVAATGAMTGTGKARYVGAGPGTITGASAWTANKYVELLYGITLKSADLANSDVLTFRVLYNGTTVTTYSSTPTINIAKTPPTVLVVQDAAHAHVSDNTTLTQTVVPTLVVANAAHTVVSDTPIYTLVFQEGFRWRNDDGSETSATWMAAQDTNASLALATAARLRVVLDTTADAPATAYTLYYKKSTDSTWAPVPVGAGGAGAIAFRSAGTPTTYASGQTSTVIPAPAGIVNGDLLLFVAFGGGGPAATPTPPAGLTQITGSPTSVSDASSFNGKMWVYYKIASGESGSYTFTHPSQSAQGFSLSYSGVDQITPFDVTPTTSTGTGSTLTATGLTTVTNGSMLVFIEHDWGDDNVYYGPPSGMTERVDVRPLVYAADEVIATAGASGNKTHTCNSTVGNPWAAYLIALRPAGAPNRVYVATSSNIAASGEATTAQLTAPSGKTTANFSVGRMWGDENGTDSVVI